jgi:glycosyltransferase involved in cell wall biosynthesis
MKIALLTSGIFPFQIGGIQKHSYYLAKYFAANKITVAVYTTTFQATELKELYTEDELAYIHFIEIPFPNVNKLPGHYIYASYLFSKAIYKEVSNKEYTHIYAQGFTAWCFLKKNPFQKNILTNLHGLEMFQTKINFKNKLEHFLLKIPAKLIIRNSYRQVSLGGKLTHVLYDNGAKENTVVVLPNGIDSSWVQDEKSIDSTNLDTPLKLIFIGRYERRKGIEEFQEVIQNTIDTLGYQVEFIGPIPIEKQVKNKNSLYAGMIKDSTVIKEKLIAADILVCPSYSEGMPTVILEAMACGCAIIATDVGATNTMVNDDNGWLIQGDIVSGLMKSLKKAVNATNKEMKLKKKCSLDKVKSNFTWGEVIDKTIKALEI